MISTSKTHLLDGNFHPPMKNTKDIFCVKIRKEMYKVLNLKDENSYDVFVVKMLIYYIFLSHSKVLELYIYIDDILIMTHLTLKLYKVGLLTLFFQYYLVLRSYFVSRTYG